MSREENGNMPNLIDRIRRVFPDLAIREYRFVSGGWDNYAILVNREILFRIPRTGERASRLEREIKFLACLKDSPVRIPEYAMVGSHAGAIMGGYRYISGSPLNSVDSLTDGMKSQFTDFLNYMHDQRKNRCLLDTVGNAGIERWKEVYAEIMEQAFSSLFDVLDDNTLSSLAGKFATFNEDLCKTANISPVHGDLYRGNVLISDSKDSLVGILDWGDAQMGDPAIDFAALLVDFNLSEIEEILSGYTGPVDANFRARVEFYWQVEPLYGMLHYRNKNVLLFDFNLKELIRRLNTDLKWVRS